jgi:hypothetical protein
VGPNTKLPTQLQFPRLLMFGGYNQGAIDNDSYALIKWSVILDGSHSVMKLPPKVKHDQLWVLFGKFATH